jgi:hypothetical protein
METNEHKDKMVTIIVEGTPHEWPKDEKITFDQVVTFAFPDYSPSDGKAYMVTFEKGDSDKHEGQLVKGGSIKVKEGTTFHVSRTGES